MRDNIIGCLSGSFSFFFIVFLQTTSVPCILADSAYSKKESTVLLSLFHLNTQLKRTPFESLFLSELCYSFKNKKGELPLLSYMSDVVRELSSLQRAIRPFVTQNQYVDMHTSVEDCLSKCILFDACNDCNVEARAICISDLTLNSLEITDGYVANNLLVDGDIINECCQGTATSIGNTGVTGATGATGATGISQTTENYLLATYSSPAVIGTGIVTEPSGSEFVIVNEGQEVTVPLTIEASRTDGWFASGVESNAFVVPENGVYKISYEIHLFGSRVFNYYGYQAVGWIETIGGGSLEKLPNSQVSLYSYYNGPPIIAHTLLCNLTAGDTIRLQFSNRETTRILLYPLFIASTWEDSVAASLVATKIA